MNPTPAFERKDDIWHIRVSRAQDGTAIIERLRCRKGINPATWTSDRTPEEWVGIQRDAKRYARVVH